MIYSNEFVWIHFPKAAGSKVETLFRKHFALDPNIHQDQVGRRLNPSISWHDSIADRQKRDPSFALGNRRLIVCTRRLPSWLKSRFLFELQRTPGLEHNPQLLTSGQFLERTGRVNHADKYVLKWIPPKTRLNHGLISYLRVENFASDFRDIFGKYLDLSKISISELEERENASAPADIKHDIDNLISVNMNSIYRACPLWAELESEVYG